MDKLCFAKDAGKVSKDECKMGSLPNYQCPKNQTIAQCVCIFVYFQVASDFLMIVWLDKM